MLIDKRDLDKRLASSGNLLNSLGAGKVSRHDATRVDNAQVHDVREVKQGRRNGDKNISPAIKDVIAQESVTERNSAVAQRHGVSDATVTRARHDNPDVVAARMSEVRDVALDKLLASLGVIDEEKTANLSAKDASVVARNMAAVAREMGSSTNDHTASGVRLVIYAPQQKEEKQYKTIDVELAS